jgi:hypothetical protein
VLVAELEARVAKELVDFKLPALGGGFGVLAMEGTCVIEEGMGATEATPLTHLARKVVALTALKALLSTFADTAATVDSTMSALLAALTETAAAVKLAVSAFLSTFAKTAAAVLLALRAHLATLAEAAATVKPAA